MKKISLCMIVKNEEDVLNRCLKSAQKVVDEIIIVDTGSNDSTKEIAKKYTSYIYDFDWCDDFSKARNFAFSKATSEYIMWLDADDVIPQKSIKKLLQLKEGLSDDVYMLKYNIAFCDGKPTFGYFRERIIRNCKFAVWEGCVHECIAPFGKVQRLDIAIEHRKVKFTSSNRNLNIYKKLLSTRPLTPREQYYYARELFDHKKHKQAARQFQIFISSKQGWIENVIDALILQSICYKKLNKSEKSLECLLKTFQLDCPRAKACCLIGDCFFEENKYEIAKYWYKIATKCENKCNLGGFDENIYHNYYPYLQLCVCEYKLENLASAIRFNELAGKHNPHSPQVQHNREFFNCLNKNDEKKYLQ